jgi:uncharacterized protein YcaQ
VVEEIRARGPLAAEDLPKPEDGDGRMPDGWSWGRDPRRQVLESHFGCGRLAVADRLPNMARRYDLSERVIPAEHHHCRLERDAERRALLLQAAGALGVGTAADLADYFRMPVREARPRLAELVEAGGLRQVRVEGWREPAYLDPEARLPKRIDAAALLSPFDPVVWFRPRTARLFGFDYSLEIFLPQPKRKWGYYVLPFLLGDRLVARVDLKADRRGRRLLVQAAHIEAKADPGKAAVALASELHTMANWLGLESVSVGRRGGYARQLRAAVRG